ncbi:hypothetical protein GCM10010324_10640 [Streptomyces hiroshimensis]|uniref:Uncharacterized protein n=1 Tax=Streptomyces hiroshimensis TaxID=66424 RepID=A0ABQ2Y5Y7_9ACTN|nr:hypothetical protein GCM10010324_10640 [Streptomyces hiroshimensis]
MPGAGLRRRYYRLPGPKALARRGGALRRGWQRVRRLDVVEQLRPLFPGRRDQLLGAGLGQVLSTDKARR